MMKPVVILNNVGSIPMGFAMSSNAATEMGHAANFEIVKRVRTKPANTFKMAKGYFTIGFLFV